MRVDLNIDELVLPGFAGGDRDRIGAAVRTELTRLFAENGIPRSLTRSGNIAALQAVTIRLAGRSDSVGERVARAIYHGFGK